MKSKKWSLRVDRLVGTDELFVTLPNELLKTVGWKTGDRIAWIPNKDGFILRKVEDVVEKAPAKSKSRI